MAELPSSAECVIVGGGVVGCSLAYHLARAGMRPLLLERGDFGAGSTARAAGGVRQQFTTEVNVRVGMLSRQLLEQFEDEVGSTADLRQIGYLFVASDAEQMAQFERNVVMQHAAGLDDVRVVSASEVSELVPDLNVADLIGGTFCPTDGLAGPNEVTSGYVSAARRLGAHVVEDVAVETIESDPRGACAVVAAGSRISTRMVVNCAGPHAGVVGAMAGIDVPVKPFRRHVFITESFSLARDPPFTVDMRTSFYFHPEGEGLMLGMSDPAEPSSFDTNVDWTFLEHLVEHATERLPALERAAIKTGWAGLYEVSPDNQAIVGESQLPGFWLCCGFSGHGFMQAPAVGLLLAQQITGVGAQIDLSPFSPERFARGETTPETAVI
ncbi:MAG: FAD-binding oxidoreductase [Candidatus Dormibacteraeota bacterium]|uniref:FAD-binding oxidoreductase n=1 Tax=Candidatus Amunia macphersoniae TaxID=3127014 RepID=A0A934NG67_9BACT|nr:FAD-binding oxidoreductase [Candidatus Dormibacteraeota bacterium]